MIGEITTENNDNPGIKANQNPGYCHCCKSQTVFEIYADWLRDHYVCTRCGSIPRQRHVQYILDFYFKNWEEKNIHESSPSNDFISRHCASYSSSQFFEGIESGKVTDGVRCENIESLSYPQDLRKSHNNRRFFELLTKVIIEQALLNTIKRFACTSSNVSQSGPH